MKKLALITAILCLAACNNEPEGAIVVPQPAEIAPEPVKIDHYYSMKDGYEYGYERAVSQDSADAGQAAETLMMFKYAGEKEGVYQAYSKDKSGATMIAQCENPCDFIKIMVFFNGEHISTERMKATEGTIGWYVMADAINGKLEQYVGEKNGKKVHVWFTEQSGMQGTEIQP